MSHCCSACSDCHLQLFLLVHFYYSFIRIFFIFESDSESSQYSCRTVAAKHENSVLDVAPCYRSNPFISQLQIVFCWSIQICEIGSEAQAPFHTKWNKQSIDSFTVRSVKFSHIFIPKGSVICFKDLSVVKLHLMIRFLLLYIKLKASVSFR